MRTTLTLSIKVKKMLEAIKGNMTWDNFILKTIMEVQEEYRRRNYSKLASLLEDVDFEAVRLKWRLKEY